MTYHPHCEPEHLCGCKSADLQDRIEELEIRGTTWCGPGCRGRSTVTYKRGDEWLRIECPAGHTAYQRAFPR